LTLINFPRKLTAMPDGTKLSEFVAWRAKHITGDEKGEAQLFLDRLFQAFGHAGLKEAGATLELPGTNPLRDAHAALDTAVLTAYGFNPKRDLLAQLLALNQQVAAKIENGESVTAPGVPKNYLDPKKLVTDDCIKQ
jgi:hypothetical protein